MIVSCKPQVKPFAPVQLYNISPALLVVACKVKLLPVQIGLVVAVIDGAAGVESTLTSFVPGSDTQLLTVTTREYRPDSLLSKLDKERFCDVPTVFP